MSILFNAARRIRRKMLPSEQSKALAAWFAESGDATLRLNYDLDAESIVLDVGGYEGQWASDIFGKYCCRVEIFEPVAAFATRIAHRFEKNRAIHVNRFGLGGSSRTELISLCSDGSSIFINANRKELVTIVDITEWFTRTGVRRVELMKINIEGGEYELLDRLTSTGQVVLVREIQVQFHRIARDSAVQRTRVQMALSKTHELTYEYPFVWENWRRRDEAQPPMRERFAE